MCQKPFYWHIDPKAIPDLNLDNPDPCYIRCIPKLRTLINQPYPLSMISLRILKKNWQHTWYWQTFLASFILSYSLQPVSQIMTQHICSTEQHIFSMSSTYHHPVVHCFHIHLPQKFKPKPILRNIDTNFGL